MDICVTHKIYRWVAMTGLFKSSTLFVFHPCQQIYSIQITIVHCIMKAYFFQCTQLSHFSRGRAKHKCGAALVSAFSCLTFTSISKDWTNSFNTKTYLYIYIYLLGEQELDHNSCPLCKGCHISKQPEFQSLPKRCFLSLKYLPL